MSPEFPSDIVVVLGALIVVVPTVRMKSLANMGFLESLANNVLGHTSAKVPDLPNSPVVLVRLRHVGVEVHFKSLHAQKVSERGVPSLEVLLAVSIQLHQIMRHHPCQPCQLDQRCGYIPGGIAAPPVAHC